MVNIKSLHSSDPKISQLRDSEVYRITDSNNLYLRTSGVDRRILCSTVDLKYGIGTSSPAAKLEINDDGGECLRLRSTYGSVKFSLGQDGFLSLTGAGLSLGNALRYQSGGTGYSSYSSGDLLIGSAQGLGILSKPSQIGYQLVSNGSSLEWSSHILEDHLHISRIVNQSPGIYILDVYCRNYTDTNFIKLKQSTTGALASSGVLGSCLIYSDSSTISVSSTFYVNDTITINGISKKITSAAPNSIVISSPFTFYNSWAGTAAASTTQFKFGSKSLTSTNTSTFSTITLGSIFQSPQSSWTLEFFFRLNAVTAALSVLTSNAASTIAVNFTIVPANITVSVGQGTTFNIMNSVRLASTLSANTWYHFALTFNGSSYRSFINGALLNTTNSSLQVPPSTFSSMKIAGGASTFNGFIDEFRISDSARYISAFTPTTSVFVKDANTLALNHFEAATVTLSDDNSYGTLSYSRNGGYDASQTHFLYTYATDLGLYYSTRDSEQLMQDLTTNNIRQIPIMGIVTGGTFKSIEIIGSSHIFNTYDAIISSQTNTTTAITSLNNYIPQNSLLARIMITHLHVGTTSCGVVVNGNQYLTTSTAGSTYLIVDIPIPSLQLSTNLSAAASTSSYSITLMGFVI